ncbi:unnamed protein product [Alopecurus aequalis]
MAELVVSMAIGPLVSMLKDKASSYLLDQYKVMDGMEEQHKTLKRKLPAILDVITDAEEQATAHREGAEAWLQELKMVAYEANQVFDEFNYEALRREAKKKGHYSELGLDAFKLFPTHNRIVFRYKMSRKLCRILQAMEVLISEMHAFRFKYRPQPPVSKDWRKTDHVIIDPQNIARRSRDTEKKEIVDRLLGQASSADLAVVPIIGMGGLGKTTLAQLIYNEPQIQKHFQLLLWVCVSDTFDVNSLAKSIVEASPKKNEDINKPPLDRLQKLVSGQRCLLVLDDVWNTEVHKWERLKVCLQSGGTGSAVLTTTRDKRVAEIMGANTTHDLNDLEDRFLKEIILDRAFSPGKEKPPKLVNKVDEIVKRCSGSPLAATALGSVLRSKTTVKEWETVSSRSSICTDETGILPILKLSYNDLPSHMKQCFAFCAVFPKDYKIDVDKLIHLWIANGFIPEHKESSLETIGRHIFNELASRSFFLDIEGSTNTSAYYSTTTCKIHDLMHDIAMSVMENECVVATVEPSETEWLPDTARHLYLSCEETEGVLNDLMEKRSPAIQTLLCDTFVQSPLQHPSKYRSLHALKVCIRRESFILEPKYLHQLRYLDLSNSDIKALPEDISILYNLHVLDLSSCDHLDRLPRQMKYMTSLRHLYTHGCMELKSMPPELGKLTKLQTLTCFVSAVTGPDFGDVAELQHLNLCGKLELSKLENVIEADAIVANLGNKNDLRELALRWTSVCDSEVLSNFEPHDQLQVLRIYFYGGKSLGMLQNMVVIHLFCCERLQVLFKCGTSFTFPKLKQLRLVHLLDFERWSEINEEHITFPLLEKLFISNCRKLVALPGAPLLPERLVRSAFPSLKVLKMEDLKIFQRWDATVEGVEILFPQLEELSIQRCPKLIALPESPLLQEPCIGGGYRLVRSAFPALKVLKMVNLETFERWDAAVEILFPFLEELSIEKCPKLIALPEAPLLQEPCTGGYRLVHPPFPLLENFFIRYCRKVIALPEAPLLQESCSGTYRSAFPALKVLKLEKLESFQRWDAVEETQGEHISFPQLEKLSIQGCPKLIDLPEAPKLSVLEIEKGNQEVGHWLVRYLSSLTTVILKLENTEITSEVDHSLIELRSPITGMELGCCNSFFRSGAPEPWDYFVHLEHLEIHKWDVLVHWPEKVFQILVSLRRLVISNCNNLTGYTQASLEPSEKSQHLPALEFLELIDCASLVEMVNTPASLKRMTIERCNMLKSIYGNLQQGTSELVQGSSCSEAIVPTALSELSSSPMNDLFPCLEYLCLSRCNNLPVVLHLPPSLKSIFIGWCSSIQVMSCQLDELPKPQVTASRNAPEPSAATREHSLPPCLTYLHIISCAAMLGGILRLPTSLNDLRIHNSGFTALEPLSGEPPSLGILWLIDCSTMASIPNELQAYKFLYELWIEGCPAIKRLPKCLQQQLGSIDIKVLDARYEVMAFRPKTWKEIPRMIRERRSQAEQRKQAQRWA